MSWHVTRQISLSHWHVEFQALLEEWHDGVSVDRNNEESNDNEASVAGKAEREESPGKKDMLDANGKCEYSDVFIIL